MPMGSIRFPGLHRSHRLCVRRTPYEDRTFAPLPNNRFPTDISAFEDRNRARTCGRGLVTKHVLAMTIRTSISAVPIASRFSPVRIWSARQHETERNATRRCEVETYGVSGLQARSETITRSLERSHNPKVAGSNPAPATKKTLGIPTCAEGLLASRVAGNVHVKPVSNIGYGSDVGVSGVGAAYFAIDATTRAASA